MNLPYTLVTDMELFAAALSQCKVSIWTKTADDIYALVEEGGIIVKYSPNSVKIRSEDETFSYYLREECEFRLNQ